MTEQEAKDLGLALLIKLSSTIMNVTDAVEDEGDRAYFGSTNDVEALKEVAAEIDDWRMRIAIDLPHLWPEMAGD